MRWWRLVLVLATIAAVAACGGSSGGDRHPSASARPSVTAAAGPTTPSQPVRTVTTAGATTTTTTGSAPATTVRPPATAAGPPPAPSGTRYVFPVQPPSATRYGRSHHDYPATDVFAACGTPVVAPVTGRVQEVSRVDTWDPKVNDGANRGGLSVSIVGDDGVRYYGSHLSRIDPAIAPGARVTAGQPVGAVGNSGDARGIACHLHFGISPPCGPGDWALRRGAVYPWPYLDDWRAGGQKSPAPEVRAWNAAHHGC